MTKLRPKVMPSIKRVGGTAEPKPRGNWKCEAVVSDGDGLVESRAVVLLTCLERDAWEKATGMAAQLTLIADLGDLIERGRRIVCDSTLVDEISDWREAVDAFDCYSARRGPDGRYASLSAVKAFRAASHGRARQRSKRNDDVRTTLSPWNRPLPDASRTEEYRHRVLTSRRELARTFPELPWSPELR